MDFRDFLGHFDGVSGPNARGQWSMICPCHDDKTASLTACCKPSPKDGRMRIYFFCQAGCSHSAILAKKGWTEQDLIVDPDPPKGQGKPQSARRTAPPPPPPPPEPRDEPEEKPQYDFNHPDAVYSYTDEDGRELLQVCRFETVTNGKRSKTFRQRVYDAQKGRYTWSVPAEIRNRALYRLPEMAAAIRAGRPVYVVEGEKDADTLHRLGYAATCNVGGAGKWTEALSGQFAGADVLILPDIDTAANGYAGQEHAWAVATGLKPIAKRVRLIDLKQACPDLPDKGDISDMVAIMGETAAMDALARQAAATRDFDPAAVPFWLTPMEQAERLYSRVQGYAAVGGCICQVVGDATKFLSDFIVLPRLALTKDDGIDGKFFFVLDGWRSGGERLPRVMVAGQDFDGMGWVTRNWGMQACIMPGSTNKDKVAWAIKKVGQMTAKSVTEYSHSGWRKIGRQWCFLYQGGAVGMDGVTVDMGHSQLKDYRLDGIPENLSLKDACVKSSLIMNVMKEELAVALMGTVYLAPLREFMSQTDVVPAFALYLYGKTLSGKSTSEALALAHFGNFHSKNLPASFSNTPNQIRTMAFLAKDVPLVVDDFHPTGSMQERRQMSATAQLLARAFGDNADRGRLNADKTIAPSRPPRCVAILSGEDLPAVGESGLARYFIVELERGDVYMDKLLTDLQEDARKGVLRKAMRGYIEWLIPQLDTLPEQLHDLFYYFREMIRERGGLQGRAPEAMACIMIGYHMMLQYFRDVGLFGDDDVKQYLRDALRALMRISKRQGKMMESEKPTEIFLDSLRELIASRSVVLAPTAQTGEKKAPSEEMVGYFDSEYYYILPKKAFGAVSKLCREQGVEFPVSLKALYKHLRSDGILQGLPEDAETPTRNKWIEGRAQRVLWVDRKIIDGEKPADKQMDFREVDDPDLPFEDKE